ncbi:MAG: competence protein ComK [Solibacillus sp.]
MKEIPSISDAMAIIPYTAEYGELYSIIVQDNELIKVPLKNSKILDYQLRLIGSSMNGAKDAAKLVLGTTSMHPIVAKMHPKIEIWFPSESIRNVMTCVFLSLHRIKYMEHYTDSSTIVYGYGTNDVVVPVPYNKLMKQYAKAQRYFSIIYLNQQPQTYLNAVKRKTVIIKCAENRTSYDVE